MSYKIGIVGAARRHQGTGPFIAKTFNQLGHKISGVIGTSQESTVETVKQLKSDFDIKTQAYTNLSDLLAQRSVDILVISSPPETHLAYLQEALNHGLHVFCEKPLWWPGHGSNLPLLEEYQANIQRCLSIAKEKHCLIHLNTQWPYTLRECYKLYPELISEEINQFVMHLSPQSEGKTMLVDAASHGLSMLYQLVGPGNILNIVVKQSDQQNITINFDYQHQNELTKTTFSFINSQAIPKPASYEINSHKVDRTVSLPEYQIKLQSNIRNMDIQDPLEASIQDFLASIEAGLVTDEMALSQGAYHLYQLIKSYQ